MLTIVMFLSSFSGKIIHQFSQKFRNALLFLEGFCFLCVFFLNCLVEKITQSYLVSKNLWGLDMGKYIYIDSTVYIVK